MPENKKKTRGNLTVMGRLVGLVKPLAPVMVAAVLLGVAGFLCAIFITVLGAYALLDSILPGMPISLGTVCLLLPVLAIARGVLHYAEQGCNHFIAFKLLALIRDKVFGALRQLHAQPSHRLAPAALRILGGNDAASDLTADHNVLPAQRLQKLRCVLRIRKDHFFHMIDDRTRVQRRVRHLLRRVAERFGKAPLAGALAAHDQNHICAILSAKT